MSKFNTTSIATAQQFADLASKQFPQLYRGDFGIKVNKNYIKVFKTDDAGKPSSVYGFIDEHGQLWKAAGWNAPAKNFSRGNVVDIVSSGKLPNHWEYSVQ